VTIRTGEELLEEVRAQVREVSAEEALRSAGPDTVFVDCREQNEWNLGHIPGAVFIPRGNLESKVEALVPREKRVIVYCRSGNRSVFATETLEKMGYENVASMKGGIGGWADAGGEIE